MFYHLFFIESIMESSSPVSIVSTIRNYRSIHVVLFRKMILRRVVCFCCVRGGMLGGILLVLGELKGILVCLCGCFSRECRCFSRRRVANRQPSRTTHIQSHIYRPRTRPPFCPTFQDSNTPDFHKNSY